MATAEELLAAAESASEHKFLIIDSDLRTIAIPSDFGVFGVESDDDVLRVHFRGPRFYHNVDLSTFDLRVNIKNAAGDEDLYVVDDMTADDNSITFSWLIGRFVASVRGQIEFSLCFRELGEEGVILREFNTTTATGTILEGLEVGKAIEFEYPDILETILSKLKILESVEWMATKEDMGGGGTVLSERTFTFGTTIFLSSNQSQFDVDSGTTYDVYWNGRMYVCTAGLYDDEIYLGNGHMVHKNAVADTGEPFCFYGVLSSERLTVLTKANSASETVTFMVTTHRDVQYNKLPVEFLPDESPVNITASVGQTIVVKEVDENGRPTAWEAVDYQPGVVEEFPKNTAIPGQICMLNLAGQMNKCDIGEPIHGLCIKEIERLGEVSVEVQVAGYITVPYTGATPPCGHTKLSANGQGGVKIDTSGREYFVTKFDNTNKTVTIRL